MAMVMDPVQASVAQQVAQQGGWGTAGGYGGYGGYGTVAPAGWFGNLLGSIGQPVGSAIGSAFGNQQLGSTIGGIAGQLGRFLPFSVDPATAAYGGYGGGYGTVAPAGWFGNLLGSIGQPVGSAIGSAFGNQQLGSTIGGIAGQLGRFLPFSVDPATAAYGSYGGGYGTVAPAGWFGNLLGSIAQPVGGLIGGALGNRQLGTTIGGLAGQFGRMLPFEVDPMAAAYGTVAPASLFGNIPGLPTGIPPWLSNIRLTGPNPGIVGPLPRVPLLF